MEVGSGGDEDEGWRLPPEIMRHILWEATRLENRQPWDCLDWLVIRLISKALWALASRFSRWLLFCQHPEVNRIYLTKGGKCVSSYIPHGGRVHVELVLPKSESKLPKLRFRLLSVRMLIIGHEILFKTVDSAVRVSMKVNQSDSTFHMKGGIAFGHKTLEINHTLSSGPMILWIIFPSTDPQRWLYVPTVPAELGPDWLALEKETRDHCEYLLDSYYDIMRRMRIGRMRWKKIWRGLNKGRNAKRNDLVGHYKTLVEF